MSRRDAGRSRPRQVTSEPTPEPTAEPAAEGWYPDPTCRHPWRWWDGQAWTGWVGDGGPRYADPLRPGDPLTAPGETRECTPDTSGPIGGFTAAELGCETAEPLCRIGEDRLAYATRIATHAELVASGGFDTRTTINPHTPDVADDVALGYLTDCLRDWKRYVPSRTGRYRFTATPAQACNAVWRDTAYAINHLGASDVDCVWRSFERLWLRGGIHQMTGAHSGWAETCSSVLDIVPDPDIPQWCVDFDIAHYMANLSRDPAWEEWGLTEYLNEEWLRPTYCTWMQKCIALVAQVAPATNPGQRHNSCDRRIAPQIIFIARRGNCGGLRQLAWVALLWAGNNRTLDHVADPPDDQIIDC